QWLRSRTAAMVGLVVPTRREIWASVSSAWFFSIQEIASGLSCRLEIGVYFGPLLLVGAAGWASGRILRRAFGSFSHRSISALEIWPFATGSRPCIMVATSPSAIA